MKYRIIAASLCTVIIMIVIGYFPTSAVFLLHDVGLSVPDIYNNYYKEKMSSIDSINRVVWGKDKFVAVGSKGNIQISEDGLKWIKCASGTTDELYDITWSGSLFVAVGAEGRVVTSPDGIYWSMRETGSKDMFYRVASHKSGYMALAYNGNLFYSSDGTKWAAAPCGACEKNASITNFRDSSFLLIGPENTYLTSGASWNSVQRLSNVQKTYDFINNPANPIYCRDVALNSGKCIAVGLFGEIQSTINLSTWASSNVGSNINLYDVLCDGKQIIAVGANGSIFISNNGTGWIRKTTKTRSCLYGIACNDKKYIAVGANNTILMADKSTDSLEFKPVFKPDKPKGITASKIGSGYVVLSWAPVDKASGYRIYRSDSIIGEYKVIYEGAGLTYKDRGLTPGKKYFYRMTATKDGNESEMSEVLTVLTKR